MLEEIMCQIQCNILYQILSSGLLFFSLLLPINAYSLDSDASKKLYFSADRISVNNKKHINVYRGHVTLVQGTRHLKAAFVKTISTANNQLSKAIARGKAKQKAHLWIKTNTNKPYLHAYANTIIYQPLLNRITLLGNALIKQGKNHFYSTNITYDLKHERLISNKNKNSRNTIILEGKLS